MFRNSWELTNVVLRGPPFRKISSKNQFVSMIYKHIHMRQMFKFSEPIRITADFFCKESKIIIFSRKYKSICNNIPVNFDLNYNSFYNS